MNSNYLSVWKQFEIIYGLNFSISINHLVSILIDTGKPIIELNKQKEKLTEKIKVIQTQFSNPANDFAGKTVELYCRAIIMQHALMSIQRKILKSKASSMEWDDTTIGLLNDVYRKIKGIDTNLEIIRGHFTKVGEKVPPQILKKYTEYICQAEYNSCRFELANVMKFFGADNDTSIVCRNLPDINFNLKLSWAEKLFTHRFRTSKQILTELPLGNLIILDNTDSPLLYQKSNSISKESKKYIKNTIRGNKIEHILKEAHSYNQYGLKHHGELTITDIARGREQKLQYWHEMDKLSDKLKEINFTTLSVDAAKQPLQFVTTKTEIHANGGCEKNKLCVSREGNANGNVKILIKHSTKPDTYSLVKDTHGNTEWKDIEYIPNYMGIMNELQHHVFDFGFKFNKYLANREKHQRDWTPKYKELKSEPGKSSNYTVSEKTTTKSTINKFKFQVSEILEQLPNQLLKLNFLGLMNVMATNIEEKSKNISIENVVVDDIESLSKLFKKFEKVVT